MPGLYAVLHALGVIPADRLLRLRRLGGLDGHPDVGVAGHRGQLGLARDGSLQGPRHRLGEAAARSRRAGRGDDRRRRAAGGPELGGAPGGGARRCRQAVGDRRPQRAAVGQADRRDPRARRPGGEAARLRLARGALRRSRPRRAAACLRAVPEGDRRATEGARGRHGEGEGRLVHGAPARARRGRRHLPLARRRPGRRGVQRPLATSCSPGSRAARGSASICRTSRSRRRSRRLRRCRCRASPRAARVAAPRLKESAEFVAAAYGEALEELAGTNDRLVVLDADLASDCRVRGFELAHPDRFLEVGIAEQDMVSVAAGMARHGLLPVVNSFASFLASRANEQIYNQASEGTKVVYALHYAGLIPAGPGKSHQSVRDVSLLAALPGMTVVQPCNAAETRALLRWAVENAPGSVAMRLAIGPSPRRIELPDAVSVDPGSRLAPRRRRRRAARRLRAGAAARDAHGVRDAACPRYPRVGRRDAVAERRRHRLARRRRRPVPARSSSSRITHPSVRSATRCAGPWPRQGSTRDAPSTCSASRAGRPAALRPRRCGTRSRRRLAGADLAEARTARPRVSSSFVGGVPAQELEHAGLVQHLVQVPALSRLHARRAPVLTRTPGEESHRVRPQLAEHPVASLGDPHSTGCPSITSTVGAPVSKWTFVDRPPNVQRYRVANSARTQSSACSAACGRASSFGMASGPARIATARPHGLRLNVAGGRSSATVSSTAPWRIPLSLVRDDMRVTETRPNDSSTPHARDEQRFLDGRRRVLLRWCHNAQNGSTRAAPAARLSG